MSGLRLVLRTEPERRADLSALLPERVAGLAAGAVERLDLGDGVRVGDLFAVHPGEDDAVTIEGGSERFDRLGAGMAAGTLRLIGSAGRLAGAGMTGGRFDLRGSTGDLAGAGMAGGLLEIAGDAGDHLAGPAPGAPAGMTGGRVVVRGRAGARAADRMRRGIVVIEGDCGAYPGSRMIAGTLVVAGAAGALAGVLMRRGTIVLGAGSASPGPTFAPTGRPARAFLALLARALRGDAGDPTGQGGSEIAAALLRREPQRLGGDLATLGKGEILLAAPIG